MLDDGGGSRAMFTVVASVRTVLPDEQRLRRDGALVSETNVC